MPESAIPENFLQDQVEQEPARRSADAGFGPGLGFPLSPE
jgi:hypothetical protein